VKQVVLQNNCTSRVYQRDEDPFSKLMELSLYDDMNPIRDWMENGKSLLQNKFIMYLHSCCTCLNLCVGRSNADPFLDEEDTESDTPIPNRMFTEGDDTRTVR
jgi:hypothetical protein